MMVWLAAYRFEFPSGSPIDLLASTRREVIAISGWAEVARWNGQRFSLKGRDETASGFGHSIDIHGNLRYPSWKSYKNLTTGHWQPMPSGPVIVANGVSWQTNGFLLRSFDRRTAFRLPVRQVDALALDDHSAPIALISKGDLWVLEKKRWARIARPGDASFCAADGQGRAVVVGNGRLIDLIRDRHGRWTQDVMPAPDALGVYLHAGRAILVTRGNVVKKIGKTATTIFDGDINSCCLTANRLFIGGIGGTVDVIRLK